MVVLHICPLHGDMCCGVEVAVPQHVAAQRQFADAALWNLAQPAEYEGIKTFSAQNLDDLPVPYSRPDVAVFHQVYIPRYPSLAKQLKRLGIPYIIMPHGGLKQEIQQKGRLKKAAANLLMFRAFCNNAAGIQCLTEKERDESVMGKHFFVAPNGVDVPKQTKESFHTDATRFVYIGRIDPHIKGLDLMIDAFGLINEWLGQRNCTLDIYGPEDERGVSYFPQLRERIAAKNAGGPVRLHPAVMGQEKQQVLLDADVFIQTSRTEGMPMGVLEAFSLGLPCVLTTGTGFAQKAAEQNAGWNAGSTIESIAAAVKQAVEGRENYPEMSRCAVAMSREFGWDAAAQKALEYYQSVC